MIKKIKNFTNNLNPIQFFLIASIIFGTLFVIITPPFQGPDEPVHFYRATQIAHLNLIPDAKNGVIGGDTDNGYIKFVHESFDKTDLFFKPNNTIDIKDITDLSKIKETDDQSTFIDFQATANYSPISYIAPATGIAIGDILGLPPLYVLYVARFACLFSWIFLSVLALKKIPVKKTALAIILLIPMLIFQCSVISADSLSLGTITLFLALIWNYYSKDEPISKKQLLILIVAAMVMVSTKQLNFIFLPFLLFIGKSTKKALAIKTIKTCLLFAFSFLWILILNISVGNTSFAGGAAVPDQQISYIKKNPFQLIKVFNNTYFSSNSDGIFKSLFGTFGWMDTALPAWIIALSLFIVIFAIFSPDKNTGNTKYIEKIKKWKIKTTLTVTTIIAITYFIAVNLTLYIYYTPPSFEIFYGIQGRYFLPVLILLSSCPLIIATNFKEIKKRLNWLFIGQYLILIVSISTLANRYYNS